MVKDIKAPETDDFFKCHSYELLCIWLLTALCAFPSNMAFVSLIYRPSRLNIKGWRESFPPTSILKLGFKTVCLRLIEEEDKSRFDTVNPRVVNLPLMEIFSGDHVCWFIPKAICICRLSRSMVGKQPLTINKVLIHRHKQEWWSRRWRSLAL